MFPCSSASWPRSTSAAVRQGAGDRRRDGRRLGGARQMMFAFRHTGMWNDVRGTNMLDTGAPWYDVYGGVPTDATSRVGSHRATEFYAEMIEETRTRPRLAVAHQQDISRFPELRAVPRRPFSSTTATTGPTSSGQRRVRHPDPVLRRNRDRTAQRRARLHHQGRGDSDLPDAGPGSPHAARPAHPAARAPGRTRRRRPARLGLTGRRYSPQPTGRLRGGIVCGRSRTR